MQKYSVLRIDVENEIRGHGEEEKKYTDRLHFLSISSRENYQAHTQADIYAHEGDGSFYGRNPGAATASPKYARKTDGTSKTANVENKSNCWFCVWLLNSTCFRVDLCLHYT